MSDIKNKEGRGSDPNTMVTRVCSVEYERLPLLNRLQIICTPGLVFDFKASTTITTRIDTNLNYSNHHSLQSL